MEAIDLPRVDIQEIFKTHLKIEAKVMSIETLFANERRTRKTDYKPSYQRNYVWDDDKATYFIESILLGTEIPPIILFNSEEKIEVIDGRQRYETIKRFIEKEFKLKKKGLLKLRDLKNKNFEDLGDIFKDTFWDTKLRIIEFSFRDQSLYSPEKEDIVKKEIFKRYNSGITPLKSVEIDKAKYQDNNINTYFKKRINANKKLQNELIDIFFLDSPIDIEKALKKIRQLIVLQEIPIYYFSNVSAKQEIIERFFEHMSNSVQDIEGEYISFTNKISVLIEFRDYFSSKALQTNRLIYECLFWALSIIEKEGHSIEIVKEESYKQSIYTFISKNLESYRVQDSNFYRQVNERYEKTVTLFGQLYNLDLELYLNNNNKFRETNKELSQVKTDTTTLSKFDSLRLNKPDASSNPIDDICSRMAKERFLLRPSYQRKEVIDRYKSSAIIESILLGIKLPPIFLYKRNDGVAEVLDGQQRLLSILGFLGRKFLDENKRLVPSEKDKFSLRRLNILKDDIEGKKFDQLPTAYQDRILDFDLWIIEISEKNNPDFDPIDLFIRLNYKPFPISENTFEMWNSYVDKEIINQIKSIYNKYKNWFYVRRDNRRMDNEGLITYLSFLEFVTEEKNNNREVPAILDIYKSSTKLNIRIQAKSEITRVLEDNNKRQKFLESSKNLENNFILKVKELVSISVDDNDEQLKNNLDNILGVSSKRAFQSFYALWTILLNIPHDSIKENKEELKASITEIIREMKSQKDIETFKKEIKELQNRFN